MNTVPQNTMSSNREYTLLAAWQQWRLGWDFYTAGEIVNVCRNAQQRRGYFAALYAASDTETFSYLTRGNR